jgi:hypothetical protein
MVRKQAPVFEACGYIFQGSSQEKRGIESLWVIRGETHSTHDALQHAWHQPMQQEDAIILRVLG